MAAASNEISTGRVGRRPAQRTIGRISIAAAIVVVLALVAGCDRPAPAAAKRRDIYLLLVDTLRADHLSLYGYGRRTSPNLDRFAESATVFEHVVAPASWTLPSVASVLTGLYPSAHGLRARAHAEDMTAMRPAVKTLAGALASEGYRTVAVITNPWLINEEHGLARGFEEYLRLSTVNAPRVNDLARDIISKSDPRPLFLYLHYMDPHGPFDRHPASDSAALGPLPAASDRRLTTQERLSMPEYLRLPGKTDLGTYIEAYDGAIRAWDESFGDLIAWLETRTGRPAPLIAVVADHGEEFTEHGGWNHGETLYEEQLFVPWVLRLPGRPPRRVSDRVVSLIDVAPTLLAAVEAPIAETMVGSDVLADDFHPDRPVFAETDVRLGGIRDPRFVQRAVRRGDTKHIERPSGPECYDLARDRSERRSSCAGVSWRERAVADIERWNRENRELADLLGPAEAVPLDEEQRERLRSIGYLD